MALVSGRHRIESAMVQLSTKHTALPAVVDHHGRVAATQLVARIADRSARTADLIASCRGNPGVTVVGGGPSAWVELTCGTTAPSAVDRFALFKPFVGGFASADGPPPELRAARCHRTEGVAHVAHRSRQVHQRCHRQTAS